MASTLAYSRPFTMIRLGFTAAPKSGLERLRLPVIGVAARGLEPDPWGNGPAGPRAACDVGRRRGPAPTARDRESGRGAGEDHQVTHLAELPRVEDAQHGVVAVGLERVTRRRLRRQHLGALGRDLHHALDVGVDGGGGALVEEARRLERLAESEHAAGR